MCWRKILTMTDLVLINTRTWETCFTTSYTIQIGTGSVRGLPGEFDHSTDKVKIILLMSKAISRSGRCDLGTSSNNDVVK